MQSSEGYLTQRILVMIHILVRSYDIMNNLWYVIVRLLQLWIPNRSRGPPTHNTGQVDFPLLSLPRNIFEIFEKENEYIALYLRMANVLSLNSECYCRVAKGYPAYF